MTGVWETENLLSPEEYMKDRETLAWILEALPPAVVPVRMTFVVNGHRWLFRVMAPNQAFTVE